VTGAPDPLEPLLARAGAEMKAGRQAAAEALYRDALARAPGHPGAQHFLGVCLVQSGRAEEGLALLAQSMASLGGDARYRHNHALMLAQAGRLDAAERELQAAIVLDPGSAGSHYYLGLVRQRLGRPADAAAAFRAGVERVPDDPLLAGSYGNSLLEQGDPAGAIEWLGRAVERNPRNAAAHSNLGNALQAVGQRDAAIASYRKAVALEPRYAPAWYNLGRALREAGDDQGAFEALRSAVRAGPAFAPAWQAFADEFAKARFVAWDGIATRELTDVLRHPAIDPGPLAAAAASLLALDPAFGPVLRELPRDDEPAAAWFGGDRLARLAHPMLLALIEDALVPDPDFEAFLRALRRRALDAWTDGALRTSPPALDLLCALAQQCFLNEYVWPEEAPETARVARLGAAARAAPDALAIALLACYRPLAAIDGLAPPSPPGESFARLWRRQIEEPAEERRLRDAIPALTPIDDATSRAVQAQYEENPYPRWHRLPASLASPFPLRRALRELLPHVDPARWRVAESPDVLIAGCGTGYQTAITAARNPGARLLAVDLSRTSLAYALRRARELGLANVRFAQADLLQLGSIAERFDLIECAGVLHHLHDPLAGWRVLVSLLKPGGVMKIGLYSELGRRGVVTARALIEAAGIGRDRAGIGAARTLVLALPPDSPARNLTLARDFYSASGARDLLLHVQEHRFTLGALAQAIDALGLEFLGFESSDPTARRLYRARFPDDLQASSLANWARIEAEHPDAFAGMYQFWVARRP
jgi:tetratricopeptide (TPR) repeat protein/SAM-dependent methyltransferase